MGNFFIEMNHNWQENVSTASLGVQPTHEYNKADNGGGVAYIINTLLPPWRKPEDALEILFDLKNSRLWRTTLSNDTNDTS